MFIGCRSLCLTISKTVSESMFSVPVSMMFGDDQEQLYHELGLIIPTLTRREIQSLEDL
jgi:hypothetical protein